MSTKTLALLALASTSILATPFPLAQSDVPSFGDKIGIEATGTNIAKVDLRAKQGQIFVGGSQDAVCDGGQTQDVATFVLYSDGTLFLYKLSNPPQQLWVDNGGNGGGVTGYTSGSEPLSKSASRSKFALDGDGNLTFEGTGAKACPTKDADTYTVWFTSSAKPGNQDGCVDIKLKAYKAPARVACEYSHSP
ncbi:uncharacterized protein MYCFIDRAFT_210559 [Pseudocercospora fijiensis CIRAD86]|uniref:Cell wall protein PhiA n=1 Tax=Pseudocercospora fijiensis (strain CIRAD86) TaxID=383855 RepID=M3APS9_PSEFD|nr:uncharacterized protein MYCFIDRAFT_210559 [Pseudocercospora fijiensis CIRAD86]EME86621.1 hypothetical protein MYCFIDRAFT_210559 [Pseudocercospora fijiensis CIRAD86]